MVHQIFLDAAECTLDAVFDVDGVGLLNVFEYYCGQLAGHLLADFGSRWTVAVQHTCECPAVEGAEHVVVVVFVGYSSAT